MALKIWKDGAMKKIDTNLHKPVIFINGDKYKLDKAYTFVNGQKQMIWGESGVQIDYISSTGVLGGGKVFCISEYKAYAYQGYNIYQIDISNLSSPALITNPVLWGNVFDYNAYLSSGTDIIFQTYNNSTKQCNRLKIDGNGDVSAIKSFTFGGTSVRGFVDNYVFSTSALTQVISSTSQTRFYTYGTDYYWNTEKKYSTGTWSSSPYQNYNAVTYYSGRLQVDSNTVLINISANPGGAYTSGLYKATHNGLTKVSSNIITGMEMLDGDVICRTLYEGGGTYIGEPDPTSLALIDKTSFAELYKYPLNPDIDHRLKFLGRIGNYYYVIIRPATNITGQAKLVLLSSNNLSVAYEKQLPDDPFNENNGNPTFWLNCNTVPQISQTGFLGVSTYNTSTLGLRIVRFSGLI